MDSNHVRQAVPDGLPEGAGSLVAISENSARSSIAAIDNRHTEILLWKPLVATI